MVGGCRRTFCRQQPWPSGHDRIHLRRAKMVFSWHCFTVLFLNHDPGFANGSPAAFVIQVSPICWCLISIQHNRTVTQVVHLFSGAGINATSYQKFPLRILLERPSTIEPHCLATIIPLFLALHDRVSTCQPISSGLSGPSPLFLERKWRRQNCQVISDLPLTLQITPRF